MEPYLHKVQYYETDKMGIVHHSNYIRWMEEARVDFWRKSAGVLTVWKRKASFLLWWGYMDGTRKAAHLPMCWKLP